MLAKLEQLLAEVEGLNSKLILLVGRSGSGKTSLLRNLGSHLGIEPLNVSLEVGQRLVEIPSSKRSFSAAEIVRDLSDRTPTRDVPLLLDNLELLFEPVLQINPLELLRRLAHAKRVVASWPGALRGERLSYAEMGHREHRDYSTEGLVIVPV